MPVHPRRRGVPKTFSFDPDCLVLLRAMTPNSRGVGLLLSELIRKEARERVQRSAWATELARQARAALAQEVERACG